MEKMPVLFIGHGSPMNAIEDNKYTKQWKNIANKILKPKVILSISAHWYTHNTRINNDEKLKTIYDMYGFPQELYEVKYDTIGSPKIAELSKELILKKSKFDNSWGIDHGTWSVLIHMYPNVDIPVFQISIDADAPAIEHYKIGKQLKSLRNQGVLLFSTGNIVHNLRLVDWNMSDKGYDWAYKFDDFVFDNIMNKNYEDIVNYKNQKDIARLAIPTPDHFYPLLYSLGAVDDDDKVSVYNKSCELGSLSMTSYLWE
ncbi:MAG: 4,5-DOPA dioxygenase extradiol [Erysipelotrichaceae bacterium]|nr:4,5-DOPA dioxygenase extradiol [Erysipelotrichaceae bacterium]